MRTAFRTVLAVVAAVTFAGTTRADAPTADPAAPRFEGRPIVRAAPRFELIDESGFPLTSLTAPDGRRFVEGTQGQRYRIALHNPTATRIEAVISVDGLDAIDGKPASFEKRGYVIPALSDVVVEGWRTSLDSVAAFRFSALRDSYAARTGDARNVGVIGVALFREQPPQPPMAWRRGPRAAATGAPAPAPSAAARSKDDTGIGTRFGEAHESRVVETSFVRATTVPTQVNELRYDDRRGLIARGIAPRPLPDDRWSDLQRRDAAEPFAESRFAQPPR
jgi:hypothetical protein